MEVASRPWPQAGSSGWAASQRASSDEDADAMARADADPRSQPGRDSSWGRPSHQPRVQWRREDRRPASAHAADAQKKCGHCQEMKSCLEFSADVSRGDGLRGWCKHCEAEARSNRYKRRKAAAMESSAARRRLEQPLGGLQRFHDPPALSAAPPNVASAAAAFSQLPAFQQQPLRGPQMPHIPPSQPQRHIGGLDLPFLQQQMALFQAQQQMAQQQQAAAAHRQQPFSVSAADSPAAFTAAAASALEQTTARRNDQRAYRSAFQPVSQLQHATSPARAAAMPITSAAYGSRLQQSADSAVSGYLAALQAAATARVSGAFPSPSKAAAAVTLQQPQRHEEQHLSPHAKAAATDAAQTRQPSAVDLPSSDSELSAVESLTAMRRQSALQSASIGGGTSAAGGKQSLLGRGQPAGRRPQQQEQTLGRVSGGSDDSVISAPATAHAAQLPSLRAPHHQASPPSVDRAGSLSPPLPPADQPYIPKRSRTRAVVRPPHPLAAAAAATTASGPLAPPRPEGAFAAAAAGLGLSLPLQAGQQQQRPMLPFVPQQAEGESVSQWSSRIMALLMTMRAAGGQQ